jgi:hypothetical protein
LIGTILNIAGKTKDTTKARLHLKDLGIKKELKFREDGDSVDVMLDIHCPKKKGKPFVIFKLG